MNKAFDKMTWCFLFVSRVFWHPFLEQGWDAFPLLKRMGEFGEQLSALMVHLGIIGLERSIVNAWVFALIYGDDSNLK